jgi:hypothetical protein
MLWLYSPVTNTKASSWATFRAHRSATSFFDGSRKGDFGSSKNGSG